MLPQKMMAGIAALTITASLSTGTAYAALSYGDSIKGWYTSSFEQLAAEIGRKMNKEADAKISALVDKLLTQDLPSMTASIEESEYDALHKASLSVDEHELMYTKQVNAALEQLLDSSEEQGQIHSDMKDFAARSKEAVNEELEESMDQFLENLMMD